MDTFAYDVSYFQRIHQRHVKVIKESKLIFIDPLVSFAAFQSSMVSFDGSPLRRPLMMINLDNTISLSSTNLLDEKNSRVVVVKSFIL